MTALLETVMATGGDQVVAEPGRRVVMMNTNPSAQVFTRHGCEIEIAPGARGTVIATGGLVTDRVPDRAPDRDAPGKQPGVRVLASGATRVVFNRLGGLVDLEERSKARIRASRWDDTGDGVPHLRCFDDSRAEVWGPVIVSACGRAHVTAHSGVTVHAVEAATVDAWPGSHVVAGPGVTVRIIEDRQSSAQLLDDLPDPPAVRGTTMVRQHIRRGRPVSAHVRKAGVR